MSFAVRTPSNTSHSRAVAQLASDAELGSENPRSSAELDSLRQEADSELFLWGLLNFGFREAQRGRPGSAAKVYSAVLSSNLCAPFPELRGRAQAQLEALLGRGGTGERIPYLLDRFTREALHPVNIFALVGALTLFRAVRWTTFSYLRQIPSANFWTRGMGAQSVAGLAAFSVEGASFPILAKLGHLAMGENQNWAHLYQEVLGSYLWLGALRLAGKGSQALYQTLHGSRGLLPWFAEGARAPRLLYQQSGMLAGIMLGKTVESRLNLASDRGGHLWVDSLGLLLQFNVAGRLVHALSPPSGFPSNYLSRYPANISRNLVFEPSFPVSAEPGLRSANKGRNSINKMRNNEPDPNEKPIPIQDPIPPDQKEPIKDPPIPGQEEPIREPPQQLKDNNTLDPAL